MYVGQNKTDIKRKEEKEAVSRCVSRGRVFAMTEDPMPNLSPILKCARILNREVLFKSMLRIIQDYIEAAAFVV